jgi:hypothetical protein
MWLQLLGNLVRFLLVFLFGVFTSKGIISQELADKLADSGSFYIVSFLLIVVPVVWQYLKTRYNLQITQAALDAAPETTIREIKKRVLTYGKLSLPV